MGFPLVDNPTDFGFGLTLVAISCATSHLCRQLASDNLGGSSRHLVHEALVAFELAVFAFEVNYILWPVYGVYVVSGSIFSFLLYRKMMERNAAEEGNPVSTLKIWTQRKIDWQTAVGIMFAQIAGAAAAYGIFVKLGWTYADRVLGANAHTTRMNGWASAVYSDPKLSALTEGGVVFLFVLLPPLINKLLGNSWTDDSSLAANGLIAAIFTAIGVSGAQYSGAFYNPAVATVCEIWLTEGGASILTKVWIYWLSPFLGLALGMFASDLF